MRYIRKPYEIDVYTVEEIATRDDLPEWTLTAKKMLGMRGFKNAMFVASSGDGSERYYTSEESLLNDYEPKS